MSAQADTHPVGFAQIIDSVVADPYPFQILTGPAGIGKFMAVRAVADRLAPGYAQKLVRSPGIAQAREIIEFAAMRRPAPVMVVGIDFDGSTPGFVSAILKTTEELPAGVRVVASSSQRLPVTILSRAQSRTCPALSTDQVRQVLVGLGFSPAAAITAAGLSAGSVATALAYGQTVSEVRALAAGIVAGLKADDPGVVSRALVDLPAGVPEVLRRWAVESICDRPELFERPALGTVAQAGAVLKALRSGPDPVLGLATLVDSLDSAKRFARR